MIEFLFSIENELDLFREFSNKIGKNTGEDDYSIFLGHLKEELHLQFKDKNMNEKIEVVRKKVIKESEKHKEIIDYNLSLIKKKWEKIEKEFITECETIFDNHKFPRGRYKAFISLWGRYNRDLNKKTLSFPCYTPSMIVVIIHELLHFMFYDFLNNKFKEIKLSQEKIWDLSEIINPIIMNKEPFISWTQQKSKPYTKHMKDYKRLLITYEKSSSMKEFINNAILVLKD